VPDRLGLWPSPEAGEFEFRCAGFNTLLMKFIVCLGFSALSRHVAGVLVLNFTFTVFEDEEKRAFN